VPDAKITISTEGVEGAGQAFAGLREVVDGTGKSLRETGESGIWLLDRMQDLGSSFVGRVAEGVLLRDAVREVLGGVKDLTLALPELIDHTIEFGSHLYDMSLKTGASVEGLSALRYVAGQTGIDFESFSTSLYKMEVALGANGAKADELQKHLDKLHLNLKTLKDEKPDQAFIDIMTALEAMPNRADQAATGVAIFGKGFKDMAGLTHESMGEMIQQAKDLGLVMTTESAAAADVAGDAFNRMKLQVESLGLHIAGAFVPAIAGLSSDLSVGLNNAVKTLNASLADMGGDGGFLSTVATAMGTGDAATKAQMQLYGELKDTLISLTRNSLEPLVSALGFVMTEWNAAKVVFGDMMQIVDGDALAFEYLALGIAKTLNFLHAGDWSSDIQRINGNIDDLLTTMAKRGEALDKDKVAEREWGNWAVAANQSVEVALNAVAATHTDLAATIEKGAEQSRAAFGGVGDAVEHGKEKVDKFKQAMAEVASVGTSWSTTLLTIDGNIVDAAENYIRAGLSLSALKEMYALTDTQVKALGEAVKEQAAWEKELDREHLEQIKLVAEEDKKAAAERARLLKEHNDLVLRTFTDERRMETDHYDFIVSRALSTEQAQRLSIDRWYQDAVAKARALGIVDQKYYDDLAQEARDKMQQVTDAHDLTFQAVKQMQEDLTTGWQQHFADTLSKGDFSVKGFANAFEGVFQIVKDDVSRIFSDLLTNVISGFLQPLLDNVRGVASNISSMLMGALTGNGGGDGAMSWVGGSMSGGAHSLLGSVLGGSAFAGFGGAGAAGGLAIPGAEFSATTVYGGTAAASGGGILGGLGSVAGFLATNPIGWAIDAGIGALALWNHFSGPSDEELAGRSAYNQWKSDVWAGLSPAQRTDAQGAGWSDAKDAGAMIWMRTMYTNLGRPDPEKSAENFMQNVFNSLTKGYSGVVSSIQDVASFANEGFAPSPTLAIVGDRPGGEYILHPETLARLSKDAYDAGGAAQDRLVEAIVGLHRTTLQMFQQMNRTLKSMPTMQRDALARRGAF
jgi:hypothetical protein